MPWVVNYSDENHIIRANFGPDSTLEDWKNALIEVKRISGQTGIRRVLVDVQHQNIFEDIIELYAFAADLPKSIAFAILCEIQLEIHKFIENVAVNRGISVKDFQTEDESIEWLQKWPNKIQDVNEGQVAPSIDTSNHVNGIIMKEWTEHEIRDKSLMAACGLYCGACGLYIATRDDNEKLKKFMVEGFKSLYGSEYDTKECLGCMQTEPPKMIYGHCKECKIRDCVKTKGYYSCHQCHEWPCSMIEGFPLAMARRIINRTIPIWRSKVDKHGDGKGSIEWARSECERYHCSSCNSPLIRGVQYCEVCGSNVADELDGPL